MSVRRSSRLSLKVKAASPNAAGTESVPANTKSLKRNGEDVSETTISAKAPRRQKDPAALTTRTKSSNGTADIDAKPAPLTPNAKRPRKTASSSISKPPPFTPTPSAVKLIAKTKPNLPPPSSSSSSRPVDQISPSKASTVTPRKKNRPADPHATNAPLATPGGSKIVAYSDTSPVKWSGTGVPKASTTTTNLLEEACNHLLSVDPNLKAVIEQHHCKIFSPEGLAEAIDPFSSLASGIMAQQVSGAAAASIKRKFIGLFPSSTTSFPAPELVAVMPIETLRTAGLSQRKAEYIQGLAEKFASGELSAKMLIEASDEEVLEKLVAVRGLGRWSVEMFACFGLKRMDVFSTGDLGVQRGMAHWLGRDVAKLKNKGGKWKYVSEKDMLEHSAKFSPYRSLFMWYMWRIEDVDVSAIQGV